MLLRMVFRCLSRSGSFCFNYIYAVYTYATCMPPLLPGDGNTSVGARGPPRNAGPEAHRVPRHDGLHPRPERRFTCGEPKHYCGEREEGRQRERERERERESGERGAREGFSSCMPACSFVNGRRAASGGCAHRAKEKSTRQSCDVKPTTLFQPARLSPPNSFARDRQRRKEEAKETD